MRVTVWNKKNHYYSYDWVNLVFSLILTEKSLFSHSVTKKLKSVISFFHCFTLKRNSQFIVTCYFVSALFHFRYICVCVPLKHNELSNRRLIICMVFMYFASVVANWGTPLVGKFSQHSTTWNVTQLNSKWFVILQQKSKHWIYLL